MLNIRRIDWGFEGPLGILVVLCLAGFMVAGCEYMRLELWSQYDFNTPFSPAMALLHFTPLYLAGCAVGLTVYLIRGEGRN